MSKYEKYVICLIIIGVAVWVGWQWLEAHDDLKQAESTIAMNEAQHKQEVASLQTQLEAIKHDRSTVKTPQAIIRSLPNYIPLPSPIKMDSNVAAGEPPVITIPPQDLAPLFQFATDCKACQLQHQADVQTIAELTRERDSALKAAKGGSFIRRVVKGAKIFGMGLGIGLAIGVHGI